MSEIEKMYKLAQIANEGYDSWDMKDIYPPFIAEKQIELIIFFVNLKGQMIIRNIPTSLTVENFGDKLALTINRIWQNLTEEERKQIKEILE